MLVAMVRKWSTDARYSHGFLVPVFSCYLLYQRRGILEEPADGGSWWGIGLLSAGLVSRLLGAYYFVDWLGAVALLPIVAGIALLVGGRRGLRWSWPSIAFLVFMIPLPYRVETALGWPLQRLATEASTYLLQTLGLPALAEGNVIDVDGRKLGVVEACNGLGMLFTFFAFTAGAVILMRRPLLERLFVLLSAIPAALVANVARITLTGVLHVLVGSRWADVVFHDLAGWLMMPLAVGMLWVELEILSRLYTIETPSVGPPAGFSPG
jgi:exosortase